MCWPANGGLLRDHGHDVLDAAQFSPDPGDAALLEMAAQQDRIVITLDSDFGTLIFRDAAEHSGLIRLPSVPPERRIALLEQVLLRHADDVSRGAVVTVRGTRIRISRSI